MCLMHAHSVFWPGRTSVSGPPRVGRFWICKLQFSSLSVDRLRHNVLGGVTAAVLSVPTCVGFGILALAPLGPGYVQHGVLAGLYAAVCGGIVSALMGGRDNTVIYAPRGIVTFLISALVAQNLISIAHDQGGIRDPDVLMSLLFLMVFVAGALQMAYGFLKFGVFAKYLPAPVLAGFQVAGSLLIFVAQIPAVLGLPAQMGLINLPGHINEIEPWTLAIGILTGAAMMLVPRFLPALPAHLAGIIVGSIGFYAFAAFGLREYLGPLIGAIDWSWPTPHFFLKFKDLLISSEYRSVVVPMLTAALSLSVVGSLDTLLAARTAERRLGLRIEGNRELRLQGFAGMLAAGFGGIGPGINLNASFANQRGGATGPVSILCYVALILSGLLLPVISMIPRVVIASMMIAAAIQLFDRWTLDMIGKVVRGRAENRAGVAADLGIVAIVACVAIVANVGLAVMIGFVVTIALFLLCISKSVIRREYTCDTVRSRKIRDAAQMAALAIHGKQISVIELEGPVFFGTSETLAARLEALRSGTATHILLDLKRVNELDSSGARVMLQGYEWLKKSGQQLILSGAADRPDVSGALRDAGVYKLLGDQHVFADADAALEWAEDCVLARHPEACAEAADYPLEKFDTFAEMTAAELRVMQSVLVRQVWRKGETVFEEGDAGDKLFFISQGAASVRINMPGDNRSVRLVTFSPGTLFGELALLDREVRSATVTADTDLVCHVISYDDFLGLSAGHPALAIKLMTSLGRELSGRLRRANRTIHQLEG